MPHNPNMPTSGDKSRNPFAEPTHEEQEEEREQEKDDRTDNADDRGTAGRKEKKLNTEEHSVNSVREAIGPYQRAATKLRRDLEAKEQQSLFFVFSHRTLVIMEIFAWVWAAIGPLAGLHDCIMNTFHHEDYPLPYFSKAVDLTFPLLSIIVGCLRERRRDYVILWRRLEDYEQDLKFVTDSWSRWSSVRGDLDGSLAQKLREVRNKWQEIEFIRFRNTVRGQIFEDPAVLEEKMRNETEEEERNAEKRKAERKGKHGRSKVEDVGSKV